MKVIVNGSAHELPDGNYPTTYEQLVELAAESGAPSMTVSFGDKSRAAVSLARGEAVELDDGARINAIHTGNA